MMMPPPPSGGSSSQGPVGEEAVHRIVGQYMERLSEGIARTVQSYQEDVERQMVTINETIEGLGAEIKDSVALSEERTASLPQDIVGLLAEEQPFLQKLGRDMDELKTFMRGLAGYTRSLGEKVDSVRSSIAVEQLVAIGNPEQAVLYALELQDMDVLFYALSKLDRAAVFATQARLSPPTLLGLASVLQQFMAIRVAETNVSEQPFPTALAWLKSSLLALSREDAQLLGADFSACVSETMALLQNLLQANARSSLAYQLGAMREDVLLLSCFLATYVSSGGVDSGRNSSSSSSSYKKDKNNTESKTRTRSKKTANNTSSYGKGTDTPNKRSKSTPAPANNNSNKTTPKPKKKKTETPAEEK